jgi:hypothetical protein
MNTKKYFCETCNFGCNYISIWNQHIETTKHKNNGILIRTNIKESSNKKCNQCYYIAKHNEGLKSHILTRHMSKEDREKEFPYYCKLCDFGSFREIKLNLHNKTQNHIMKEKYLEDNKSAI